MRRIPALSLAALVLLGGCASEPMPKPGQDGGVGRAVGQPFRDLSLIRDVAPPVLQRAAIAPYAVDGLTDCPAEQAAVAELDATLGPDLSHDAKTRGFTTDGLAGDLVSGAVGLPFRGVVRVITGAEARDRALREAVLAGMVRRGFVKGRMNAQGCQPPKPVTTAAAH